MNITYHRNSTTTQTPMTPTKPAKPAQPLTPPLPSPNTKPWRLPPHIKPGDEPRPKA